MGSRNRYQKDHYQQESHRITTASKFKKPPSGRARQPTVPSWEKRFCTSVCKIPWRKIRESKRFEASYQSIIKWNDSASKEAIFQNAKSRYWAEINGLPYDISLPDQNLFIDVIDWSSSIDPKLLSALDGERTVSEQDGDHIELEILDSGLWNQPIIPTGWGDDDDNLVMKPSNTMTHGGENYNRIADNSNICDHGEENKVDKAWDSEGMENRGALNNSYGNADSSNLMRGLAAGINAWGKRIQESKPRTMGGVNGGRNVKVVENDEFRKNGGDWRTGAGYWQKKERRPACRAK